MTNLWKMLNEDSDLDLEPVEDRHVEYFVNGLNDYSKKAKECAIQYIKDCIENDWLDDDGSLVIDAVYEWAQFDSLQEIFDYITETDDTNFEEEIRNEAGYDLWGIYDYKICNEVERILYKYNQEFFGV